MRYDPDKRIAVTGIGVISSIGFGKDAFWEGLKSGKSGISPVESFETEAFERHRGGEIKDFDIAAFFPGEPDLETLGRCKQLMLAATKECIEDSGYEIGADPYRVGLTVGTTMGESKALEAISDHIDARGHTDIPIDAVEEYQPYTINQSLAAYFGIYGSNVMLPNACAAGNFSIDHSVQAIRAGRMDAVIAGGVDAFSRYAYSGFARLGAIAPDVPRPFSKDRRGMIPGEGAAAVFIETHERAVERGAHIYAEILGFGESCDAHHITQPHDEGVAQAIYAALRNAGVEAGEISFVSVHGTGTPTNDSTEYRALKHVFGERLRDVPISAVKSMIGHAMGASSIIEGVACLLSIEHQFLTPTTNYLGADEEMEVDCIPNVGRPAEIELVLKTSSAFGGNNSAIIYKNAATRGARHATG